MTVCEICDQEMTTAAGCVAEPEPAGFVTLPRVRHGTRNKDRCGDCGVLPGSFHHLGCDMERCRRCWRQLITCGCLEELYTIRDERQIPPVGAVVGDLRTKHRAVLKALATWALQRGRAVDLDMAAVTFEVLERHTSENWRSLRMQRPDVADILQYEAQHLLSMRRSIIPRDAPLHVWSVIAFLAETGRLSDGSDPLAVLLEPLECYAGVGADGQQLPKDRERRFTCLCHEPYRPGERDEPMRERHGPSGWTSRRRVTG